MTKKERAIFIQATLNALFPSPTIPLKHKDAYTFLIAVLLSAQSTDQRVNLITPLLFARADTPEKMTELTIEEIKNIIQPCGLGTTKAKAIWHLSLQLLEKHGGCVPDSFEELERLRGVGHKTASVIMSQIFHQSAFPVDTHIHRCAKRWGLSNGSNVRKTEHDLKHLFPKDRWNIIHLQIIYFARKYCPARGHNKDQCPICNYLYTLKTGPKALKSPSSEKKPRPDRRRM